MSQDPLVTRTFTTVGTPDASKNFLSDRKPGIGDLNGWTSAFVILVTCAILMWWDLSKYRRDKKIEQTRDRYFILGLGMDLERNYDRQLEEDRQRLNRAVNEESRYRLREFLHEKRSLCIRHEDSPSCFHTLLADCDQSGLAEILDGDQRRFLHHFLDEYTRHRMLDLLMEDMKPELPEFIYRARREEIEYLKSEEENRCKPTFSEKVKRCAKQACRSLREMFMNLWGELRVIGPKAKDQYREWRVRRVGERLAEQQEKRRAELAASNGLPRPALERDRSCSRDRKIHLDRSSWYFVRRQRR